MNNSSISSMDKGLEMKVCVKLEAFTS